jgi:hypothetical protein
MLDIKLALTHNTVSWGKLLVTVFAGYQDWFRMLLVPRLNKLSPCNAIAQQPLTHEANTAPYQLVHRDYFAATMTHSGGWPSLVTQPPSTAVPLGVTGRAT